MTAAPFKARAELYRAASQGFAEVIGLRLEPIGAEVRVAMPRTDPRQQVDYALDTARQMIAATRGLITQAIFKAMFKGVAPEDKNWEEFERTEFEELRERHKELTARVERLDRVRMNYRGFMEAHGWNPDAIEKLG